MLVQQINKAKIIVQNRLKGLHHQLAWQFGLDRNYFSGKKGERIICYHGVCKSRPYEFNTLFITEKQFESHLKFYKRYFDVVSLDDFYQKKFHDDRFHICLSFD